MFYYFGFLVYFFQFLVKCVYKLKLLIFKNHCAHKHTYMYIYIVCTYVYIVCPYEIVRCLSSLLLHYCTCLREHWCISNLKQKQHNQGRLFLLNVAASTCPCINWHRLCPPRTKRSAYVQLHCEPSAYDRPVRLPVPAQHPLYVLTVHASDIW